MAEETFRKHLSRLKSKQVASAMLAVDFMDGDQLDHMEIFLGQKGIGIKDWDKRGFIPLAEYLTGEIIEKSAQTYQEQPKRELLDGGGSINQTATDGYLAVLEDSNTIDTLEHADALSRLLKCAIVLVQFSKETNNLFTTVLSQHNSDVIFNRETGMIESLFYSTGSIGINNGQLYHHWTKEEIRTLELDGSGKLLNTIIEKNTFGVIPAAKLYDINPPRFGFWPKKVWEPLVKWNVALNFFMIEMKQNQRFQSFGQIVTDAKISEGTTFGPDSVVRLEKSHPDDSIFFEYKAPSSISVAIKSFRDWAGDTTERIGSQWGVNIRMAGEGSADSGFKLIVEELPGLQLRKKRHKPAVTFEKELYEAVKVVASVAGIATFPDGLKLSVIFPQPDLPVNEKEKAEVDSINLANKLTSRDEIWKRDEPNITPEQIAERKALIDADSGGATLPDFSGVEGT